MDTPSKKVNTGRKKASKKPTPNSLAISEKGVSTAGEFASLMSTLMGDIIAERIDPLVANATIRAGTNLLKIVEMKYKYGGTEPNGTKRTLKLLD